MFVVGELGATITADAAAFNKALSKADAAGEKVAGDIAKSFARSSDRIEGSLQGISAASVPMAGKLSSSFNKARRPISGTTTAVTNFNRVIQDAPFGIIGVANNLEPMIHSFQQLKVQTGSTTGALKNLLKGALTGPGALITAVSVGGALLTGLTMFGDKLFGAGEDAESAERMLEGLNTEIDVMVEAMDKLSAFDDPFGLASLNNELTAISAKESTLQTIRDEMQQLQVAASKGFGGSIQRELMGITTQQAQRQLEELEEKFGSLSEVETKLNKLSERKLGTQQEINRTQAALNSSVVKEAEARAGVFEQLKKQMQLTQDDLIPANITIPPGVLRLGAPIPIDEIIPANLPEVSEIMFPPGSLGALQEKLTVLRERMSFAFSPDMVAAIQEQIGLTKDQIAQLTGQTEESGKALAGFVQTIDNVFQQAVIHGKNLGDILANIGRQLASKALINGLAMLLSGGAFSIGNLLFGSVGSIFGVGDALIRDNGDVVKFHPDDNILAMKDFGNLMPETGSIQPMQSASVSGGITKAEMSQVFGAYLQKLGPEEIYSMSKRGQFSY